MILKLYITFTKQTFTILRQTYASQCGQTNVDICRSYKQDFVDCLEWLVVNRLANPPTFLTLYIILNPNKFTFTPIIMLDLIYQDHYNNPLQNLMILNLYTIKLHSIHTNATTDISQGKTRQFVTSGQTKCHSTLLLRTHIIPTPKLLYQLYNFTIKSSIPYVRIEIIISYPYITFP